MSRDEAYVAKGMPALGKSERAVSFFEFWPAWLMYLPVAVQWLALSMRGGSLTLPLIANPKLPVSGVVGVGKSEVMAQATGRCATAILPWVCYRIGSEPISEQATEIVNAAAGRDINFPFVSKPNLGCKGYGVRLTSNYEQLCDYLAAYPVDTEIIVQKKASWEPEAGVFYTRMPGTSTGEIKSLGLKYSPYVVGDGVSTLRELIASDFRASQLQHLYVDRHKENLDQVIQAGSTYRLLFAISHTAGGIFRDGRQYITEQLTEQVSKLMLDLPEFYYGRLDIKFRDIDSLMRGETLEIVEINAASSESLHIWDRNATLRDAIRALLWQYRTLHKIGRINRTRGFKPPAIREVFQRWRAERRLAQYYPMTE